MKGSSQWKRGGLGGGANSFSLLEEGAQFWLLLSDSDLNLHNQQKLLYHVHIRAPESA